VQDVTRVGSESERSDRIGRTCGADSRLLALLQRLIAVSTRGLPAMFRADRREFAHTRQRDASGGLALVGESPRYGSISLLGLQHLGEPDQRAILAGESAEEHCGRQISKLPGVSSLGDVALATWAAAELGHPELGKAVERLRQVWANAPNPFTVEAAWTLSALVAARDAAGSDAMLEDVRAALARAFSVEGGVFGHWIYAGRAPRMRSHVACFADQVYPIQAFSRHHAAFGDAQALEMAERCAQRICDAQGEEGQWWWHYDARTGEVVEGYPVYSVHQDAMGPMALLDLVEAGGTDRGGAIRRGLCWMENATEVDRSLIDEEIPLIWRKVARSEPGKLTRAARAALSRVHPALRRAWPHQLFPPNTIDFESRPYHLGWVLHTWLGGLG
jgi:hypothetical protein